MGAMGWSGRSSEGMQLEELELDFSEQDWCAHLLTTLFTSKCDSMFPLMGTVTMYALTRVKIDEMTNATGASVRKKKYR